MFDIKQKKLKKFYDKQNDEDYDELMDSLFLGEFSANRVQLMRQLDFKDLRVLEVGIGQGYNLKYYQNAKSIVGIDISKNMMNFAQREINRLSLNSKATLVEWDARNLKEEFIEKFDIAIFSYSLSGAPNQEKIFENVLKYVVKDGIIGILDGATLFKGNEVEKKHPNRMIVNNFLAKLIGTRDTGYSNSINPWSFIYKNRKQIKIIANKKGFDYDLEKNFHYLILQKR